MPLIAKTDGALSGNPVEVRTGVLTDIPEADRVNWRIVDETPGAQLPDDVSYVRTVPTFTIKPDGEVERTWEVAQIPNEFVKLNLKRYAAEKRWSFQSKGIYLSGHRVLTTQDSLTSISNTLYALEKGTLTQVAWKMASGDFVVLNVTQMQALHAKVATYIAQCFNAERVICNAIDAGSITTKTQIDQFAWPSQT